MDTAIPRPDRPRGIVADPKTREAVRAHLERYGWRKSYELLGVGQHPITRIMCGLPVLRSTLVAVRSALAVQEPQP